MAWEYKPGPMEFSTKETFLMIKYKVTGSKHGQMDRAMRGCSWIVREKVWALLYSKIKISIREGLKMINCMELGNINLGQKDT